MEHRTAVTHGQSKRNPGWLFAREVAIDAVYNSRKEFIGMVIRATDNTGQHLPYVANSDHVTIPFGYGRRFNELRAVARAVESNVMLRHRW